MMVTTKDVLQRFEQTAVRYMHELELCNLEQVRHKPSEGEWSIGQMVRHLIGTALDLQLRFAEQCLSTSPDPQVLPEEKTADGAAIFALGSFPPVRIQVPASAQPAPSQPDSIEELQQGLHQVIRRMTEIEPALERASRQITMPHPRFGGLCAEDWFRLVDMHYRHHLLQLDRLKQELARAGA